MEVSIVPLIGCLKRPDSSFVESRNANRHLLRRDDRRGVARRPAHAFRRPVLIVSRKTPLSEMSLCAAGDIERSRERLCGVQWRTRASFEGGRRQTRSHQAERAAALRRREALVVRYAPRQLLQVPFDSKSVQDTVRVLSQSREEKKSVWDIFCDSLH